MAIDAKKTLSKLKKVRGGNRGSVTLYMDKDLFAKFKESCGDIAPSAVIEDFIQDFLDSLKKSK